MASIYKIALKDAKAQRFNNHFAKKLARRAVQAARKEQKQAEKAAAAIA